MRFLLFLALLPLMGLHPNDLLPGPRPRPASAETRAVIGHYGEGRESLLVYERNAQVYVTAGAARFALQHLQGRTYRAVGAPAWLGGDTLRFSADALFATSFETQTRRFARRPVGPAEGDVFRITPRRPVTEIRQEARQQPYTPEAALRAADLVDLEKVIPHVKLDVRYATDNNFMGAAFYSQARAFLQRPAAEALAVVADSLAQYGYGLVIYDAYRPWSVTWAFWQATPVELRNYVANPARGSRHNRGSAVDLGLYHLGTGEIAEMPSEYDEFTLRADPHYAGGTSLARWHRALLHRAMTMQDFTVNPDEWWHYDHRDWAAYSVLNVPFEDIKVGN